MIAIIEKVYQFLWGDWIVLPLPGGSSFRFSLLVLILIPAGIWFTIRTRFLPIRLFPDMLHTLFEKKGKAEGESHNSTLSALQTLIVSTATRVGMGNLVGVVAAISAGGAGAVFWMWVTALIGSSTAFVEATLAQIYKEKDNEEDSMGSVKKNIIYNISYQILILIVPFITSPYTGIKIEFKTKFKIDAETVAVTKTRSISFGKRY